MIAPAPPPDTLLGDLRFAEGPVLLEHGWLVTEMAAERGRVVRFDLDGRRPQTLVATGRPNGLAVDRDGVLWIAESARPALLRWRGADLGETTEASGDRLLWPNDVAVDVRGVYFTDSGIRVPELEAARSRRIPRSQIATNGRLCRLDPASGCATILVDGLQFANGVAVDGDGLIYVSETFSGAIRRFRADGTEVTREDGRPFANVFDVPPPEDDLAGPDGLAFDELGRLWVAVYGRGEIAVVEADGAVVGRLRTLGARPANLAFGPRGSKTLLVVEHARSAAEVHHVEIDGRLEPGELSWTS